MLTKLREMAKKMAYISCIVFVYLSAIVHTQNIQHDLLVVYGTGTGEIRVKDVLTQKTLKTFKIQADEITGGLAMNYENDTIFYADRTRIYQIYLIDDSGQRRVSGKGELFTNTDSEHFETVLFEHSEDRSSHRQGNKRYKSNQFINGLYFDDRNETLYTFLHDGYEYVIVEVDTNNGSIGGIIMESSYYLHPAADFVLNNDGTYVIGSSNSERYARDSSRKCIYRMNASYFDSDSKLIHGARVNVSAFAIDKRTNRLFFAQRNTIQVLDSNLTLVEVPTTDMDKDVKIVIADSKVTKSVEALAVHGEVVIWSSSVLNGLFVGILNENGTFISMKNVYSIDGSKDDKVKPRNIIIFERKYNEEKDQSTENMQYLSAFLGLFGKT